MCIIYFYVGSDKWSPKYWRGSMCVVYDSWFKKTRLYPYRQQSCLLKNKHYFNEILLPIYSASLFTGLIGNANEEYALNEKEVVPTVTELLNIFHTLP